MCDRRFDKKFSYFQSGHLTVERLYPSEISVNVYLFKKKSSLLSFLFSLSTMDSFYRIFPQFVARIIAFLFHQIFHIFYLLTLHHLLEEYPTAATRGSRRKRRHFPSSVLGRRQTRSRMILSGKIKSDFC